MARKLVYDRGLFAAVMVLTGLGLVMVYSSSTVLVREGDSANPFLVRQGIAALLGLLAMAVAMHFDYRWLRRRLVIYPIVVVALGLLAVALFSPEHNNVNRWISVAGFSLQPSEIAKLALIPYIAYQIDRKADRSDSAALLVPCAGLTSVMAVMIYLGRDLGTAILLIVPPLAMIFLAGTSLRQLVMGGALVAPLLTLAVIREPYRLERVFEFLSPGREPLDTGFQTAQSLIAVGSGGLFGLGPGNSVQKLYFLPSPHADFIFSIAAEELGFLGALTIVALFGVVAWRGLRAAWKAPETFGCYLALGFTVLIVAQALIHVSVTLSLLPATGVPLPLVSHGGSSLVTTLAACGLVLNVSQHG
jgi:cell division protein FtsW